jgi:hypothetical protein
MPTKKSIRLKIPYVRIISTATKAKPQPRHAAPPQQSFSNSSNYLYNILHIKHAICL